FIGEPLPIIVSSSVTDANCGNADGTATLTITNGTAPFNEDWGGEDPMALSAGNYTVTVTDTDGCSVENDIIVNNISTLAVTVNTTDATCFGYNDGTASTVVTGGTAPYSVDWSGNDPMALTAGTYNAQVTDDLGCEITQIFSISEPTQIVAIPNITDASCFGSNDGSATLTISGGAGNYTEDWGGEDPFALAASSYLVTITDNDGCFAEQEINVGEPTEIMLNFNVTDVTCFGGNNGAIDMTVSGGTAAYLYAWSSDMGYWDNSQDQDFIWADNYYVTVTDAHYCEQSATVEVTSPEEIVVTQAVSICAGDSLFLDGMWQTSTGTYTDLFVSANGCDSTVVTDLTVDPAIYNFVSVEICDGESYFAEGADQAMPGTYYDTLTAAFGCDSIIVTDLLVHPTYLVNETATICQGESIFLEGANQTEAGIYTDLFVSEFGCDSTVVTELFVNPSYDVFETAEICEGDSYFVEGANQTLPGLYYDTLTTIDGCDSVLVTELIVNPVYTINQSVLLCDGDSYYAEGAWQTASGVFTDLFTSVSGCDSTVITDLTVTPSIEFVQYVDICDGESFFAEGADQTLPGTYYDTLTAAFGCDSVVVTELAVHPVFNETDVIEICEGDSVMLEGAFQTIAGFYTDFYASEMGCDSTVVTELIVHPVYETLEPAEICEGSSFFVGGADQTESGIYTDVYMSEFGCDSVVVTELIVHPNDFITEEMIICDGDSAYLDGAWQLASGVFTSYYSNTFGCDSVVQTQLTVASEIITNIFAEICEGESYFAEGADQTISGVYYDTLTATFGCDSIVVTSLNVHPSYYESYIVEICDGDSIMLEGMYQTVSGTYSDVYTTTFGCDSIIETELIVNPTYYAYNEVMICTGDSAFVDGAWQFASGFFTESNTTISGCDSIVETDLIVSDEIITTITANICEGDSLFAEGVYQTDAGFYYDTLSALAGCDSIIITELLLTPQIAIELGNDTTLCHNYGEGLTLDAGNPGLEYLWSDGSTDQTFDLDTNNYALGSYEIAVTVIGPVCSNTDTILVTYDICQDVDLADMNSSIRIYPNPNRGLFTLEMNSSENTIVELHDITGKVISEYTFNKGEISRNYNVSDLPKGVYYIRISNNEGTSVHKVIVQ
ncbi:MAG: hypothetical protein C0594_06800, partial [Marinilabiliales bacterium]